MTLALHYALRSDVGLLREGNEDSAYAGPHLLVIADGMGGHAAGEVASAVAVSAIAPLDHQNLHDSEEMLSALANAVASASNTLHDMTLADPSTEGMGTTLTAMLWSGSQIAMCHIGDSRAYMLRDGDFFQITRDHTLVQSLVDEGRLTPAAAATHPQRSLVMRALQSSTDADPDLGMREALIGDRYLLCSDGLSDVVTEQTLHKTLISYPDPEQAVLQLIDLVAQPASRRHRGSGQFGHPQFAAGSLRQLHEYLVLRLSHARLGLEALVDLPVQDRRDGQEVLPCPQLALIQPVRLVHGGILAFVVQT